MVLVWRTRIVSNSKCECELELFGRLLFMIASIMMLKGPYAAFRSQIRKAFVSDALVLHHLTVFCKALLFCQALCYTSRSFSREVQHIASWTEPERQLGMRETHYRPIMCVICEP